MVDLSRKFDVLVIGGGNAALCAAISARRSGASVLVLEGAPKFYRGGNTRHTRNMRCAHDAATDISRQPGITFDLVFMTVQAAIDGIGIAMGRTSYVEADIAKGRLVVPFKITLPADAGFYLVSPEAKTDSPKLAAFRQWLKASMQNKT